MTRPSPDPRADAIRFGWLQSVGAWSHGARRLLEADVPEVELSLVALYLTLDYMSMLVRGLPDVPHDAMARADCPIDPRELPKVLDRFREFRNAILHLGRRRDGQHREVVAKWSHTPPTFTITATVGAKVTSVDSITKEEIVELLYQVDAWVARHFARLLALVP